MMVMTMEGILGMMEITMEGLPTIKTSQFIWRLRSPQWKERGNDHGDRCRGAPTCTLEVEELPVGPPETEETEKPPVAPLPERPKEIEEPLVAPLLVAPLEVKEPSIAPLPVGYHEIEELPVAPLAVEGSEVVGLVGEQSEFSMRGHFGSSARARYIF
ncbi:unnamed protein product [Citrullus colocynthis]|uniref:Uncharacterized protein n=1 Tax=Citrullus colocynthis TaxID=252529 RepID=A0ABP0YRJ1_9ROSI